MKNTKRSGKRFIKRDFIDQKLAQLKKLLRDDIKYGVPSYIDGSVSPIYTLEKMYSIVEEIDYLINGQDLTKQPPATPEALEEFSEAFE